MSCGALISLYGMCSDLRYMQAGPVHGTSKQKARGLGPIGAAAGESGVRESCRMQH